MAAAVQLSLAAVCVLSALLLAAWAMDLGPAARKDVRARVMVLETSSPRSGGPATGLRSGGGELGWRHLWVTPGQVRSLQRHLASAGRPATALRTFVMIKLAAPLAWLFVGGVFASSVGAPLVWLVYFVGFGIAYMYPDIFLRARAAERTAEMVRSLPDLLDQMTIALDAGMSFESAFARVGASHQGALGPQFMRTVQDMEVGVSRRDAYLALAERNDVEDLTRLVKAMVQADEFGVPVSQVVRLLSAEMRDKRRQRAAAAAKTIPLKLLAPTMACLLPVLFIIMLTPAVMSLGSSF